MVPNLDSQFSPFPSARRHCPGVFTVRWQEMTADA